MNGFLQFFQDPRYPALTQTQAEQNCWTLQQECRGDQLTLGAHTTPLLRKRGTLNIAHLLFHLWQCRTIHLLFFSWLQQAVEILNNIFGCEICLLPVCNQDSSPLNDLLFTNTHSYQLLSIFREQMSSTPKQTLKWYLFTARLQGEEWQTRF